MHAASDQSRGVGWTRAASWLALSLAALSLNLCASAIVVSFGGVASTLALAALFNPLRHRIQSFIVRLFYREKYDARRVLETFSSRLRNETNLEALDEDSIEVVRDTMQPAHASIWLREGTRGRP